MFKTLVNFYSDGANCTDGFRINSTCYVVYNHERVDWFTAVNRCLSENGSLAVFKDNLRSYVPPIEVDYEYQSWIGLVKSWWTWSGKFT